MDVKQRSRFLTKTTLLAVLLVITVFFVFLPGIVDRQMNAVHKTAPYSVDKPTSELHRRLFIADLHADSLLWQRDLLQRSSYGHIDLPRMLESNMGLQVFSAVTKTPRNLNFERNDASSDNITALAIAQRWPIRTWTSRFERAIYQAALLHRVSKRSHGSLVIIRNQKDLISYLRQRQSGLPITAGLLAIEGMHALDGEFINLKKLYAAGYRMMGLTHFFDNAIGGSAHGINKGGLTDFGYQALGEMERLGIIIDLAHASPQLIADVMAFVTRPIVVSHTGVKGTCDRTRNLSDEQLRSIADNGGLIGIAYFSEAVCDTDVQSIVAAMRYVSDLIGFEHVALGSDFDGAVTTPFDITGLPLLTAGLRNAEFSSTEIEAIMGGNVLNLLRQGLPQE